MSSSFCSGVPDCNVFMNEGRLSRGNLASDDAAASSCQGEVSNSKSLSASE